MSHKSWITQRVANRLPPWSDARRLPHSNLQQFLNPAAEALEDLYKYSINKTSNLYLTSANLDEMDVVYTVKLPEDFEIGTDVNNLGNPMYVVPRCKTSIDSNTVWLTLASDNNIQTFWYDALPTRITDSETSVTVTSVLAETSLSNLYDATINAVCHPTRLSITISGCTEFIDLYRREIYSFIVLHGTTEREVEESEFILVPYNGTFVTKKIWKSISDVEYFGLGPSTGTIQIDCFSFNATRQLDKYQLYVTDATEKLMYHKLASKTASGGDWSVHQHLTVIANNINDLYTGNDTLEVVKEVELLYNSSTLNLVDIAVQPFTGRIFAIDLTYLYIFNPYDSLSDKRGLKEREPGAKLIIDIDSYDYVRDDIVTLRTNWRLPVERIMRNRWSVKKPDESIEYFDIDGQTSTADASWIYNKTYTEYVFGPFGSSAGDVSKQEIEYTLSTRGTYQFILETEFTDGTTEKDIVPVQAHYKEADQRILLPVALRNAIGLAFDSDQKLWLLYNDNTAKKVDIAYDIYMVDFERKMIFLRENYDSVTIYETLDWTVER